MPGGEDAVWAQKVTIWARGCGLSEREGSTTPHGGWRVGTFRSTSAVSGYRYRFLVRRAQVRLHGDWAQTHKEDGREESRQNRELRLLQKHADQNWFSEKSIEESEAAEL